MRIDNRWKGPAGTWIVPTLPPQWQGQLGATLNRGTFTPAVGPEVFLLILEAGTNYPRLSSPAELWCRLGAGETDHGPVLFLIWNIRLRGIRTASYEQFLNPLRPDAIDLLAGLARQVALKTVMVDSSSGKVLHMVELPNSYVGERELAQIHGLPAPPGANFQKAIAEFTAEHSIEELLGDK